MPTLLKKGYIGIITYNQKSHSIKRMAKKKLVLKRCYNMPKHFVLYYLKLK